MTAAVQRPNESARPQLRALDVLTGTWTFSKDVTGETTFAWLPGGFFLLQVGTISLGDETHVSHEIIGCEKSFGAADAAEQVTSRIFTDTGDTLEYTYELDGDTLTVWAGPKGSPAHSRSTVSADRSTVTGAWHWPGGGYDFVMARQR